MKLCHLVYFKTQTLRGNLQQGKSKPSSLYCQGCPKHRKDFRPLKFLMRVTLHQEMQNSSHNPVRFCRESLNLHIWLEWVSVNVMAKNIEKDCSLSLVKDLEGKKEYKRSGQFPKLSGCDLSQLPVVWIFVYPCKSEETVHQRIHWFAIFQNVISAGEPLDKLQAILQLQTCIMS